MQQFWDQRYAENETVYGYMPNAFFKQFIDAHKPGTLLLPAEGEGRNAIYAASKGWQVDAFDFSEVARQKAMDFARKEGLFIKYDLKNVEDFKVSKQYDAVALIFVHQPEPVRRKFHLEVYESIRPGGFLILEAFAKEQLQFKSGGPKDTSLLYDASLLCQDFPFFHLISCGQQEVTLDEGDFHNGEAAVLRMTGQRL